MRRVNSKLLLKVRSTAGCCNSTRSTRFEKMAKLAEHVPILNSDSAHVEMLETPKVPSLQRADLERDARLVKHRLL